MGVVPANGLALSCAALRFKNAAILGPRSGVSYSAVLGHPPRRAMAFRTRARHDAMVLKREEQRRVRTLAMCQRNP